MINVHVPRLPLDFVDTTVAPADSHEEALPAMWAFAETHLNVVEQVLTDKYSSKGWPTSGDSLHVKLPFENRKLAFNLFRDLVQLLRNASPSGCYFGLSEDGQVYGYWLYAEWR